MIEEQPQCPFCRRFMPEWGTPLPVKACDICDRPLFLFPSLLRKRRLNILSAIDVAKVTMLPIVGGATVSFGMGGLDPEQFAAVVAGALLAWGIKIINAEAQGKSLTEIRADILTHLETLDEPHPDLSWRALRLGLDPRTFDYAEMWD